MAIYLTFLLMHSASADLPLRTEQAFETADGQDNDSYGNPIRKGSDPTTGWALEIRHRATGMHFVFISPGEFMMGSPENERDRYEDEGPLHRVRISKPFYLGKYEVTQAEWLIVNKNANLPPYATLGLADVAKACEDVGQNMSKLLAERLNRQSGLTGDFVFAMPTEAQWEYACRAGAQTRFSYGDDPLYSDVGDYAWYDNNVYEVAKQAKDGRLFGSRPVGQKKPNSWGLYDMHGNVWEWCIDGFDQDFYKNSPTVDPQAPENKRLAILRGGCWLSTARDCRSAVRLRLNPIFTYHSAGFRLALVSRSTISPETSTGRDR